MMKQFIDRAGWCFTGMVALGFLWFMLWAYNEAQPKAVGYGSADRSGMDLLVAEHNTDFDSIPRLSVEDLR